LGWGDELVAAGQAQRLYDELGARVWICDCNGTPRWHPIWEGNPVIVHPDERVTEGRVTSLNSGPGCRPYIVYPFNEDTGWTFNQSFLLRDYPARIYLTDKERQRGAWAHTTYGPYVLIEPYTKHVNFRWPLERWAQLVAACPDLTFVQHTHKDSTLIPGAYAEVATFREACGLAASADVYVRSESGLCHAAAALGVRQVTLFGGCMDPQVMAGYPGQTVIADRGPNSPCGSWHPCEHCQDAMDRITVSEVIEAVRMQLRAREAA
jgi:hypothetical protein